MALVKVRILRGITIADPPVFKRGTGDPPTFVHGDVVEVDRALAQELVGSGRAEYFSGEPLIELAPYEERPEEVVTASVEPPESEMRPPARRRRGY
jgi:hypothetical protein